MKRIWAPWRDKYVVAACKKTKGCIFCKISKEKKDKKNYIFARTQHSFAVLNIYPYNNGHALILPYRHAGDLSKLKKVEREDLVALLNYTKRLLDDVLKPHGYNIGMNIGKVAGAGVPGHVHFHIVPRWNGDVNFMPVLEDTKVISQSLRSLHEKLSVAYKKRKLKVK